MKSTQVPTDFILAFPLGHGGPILDYLSQPAVKIDEQISELKEYATDRKIQKIGPNA